MKGQYLENLVEQILIDLNVSYKREGTRVARGHRVSNGKYDFELSNVAIECKEITRLRELTIPGVNPKTHKPYAQPKIKTHQLKALRRFKGTGYILILETDSNRFYALSMDNFDRYLINHYPCRTLTDLDQYEINLDEWIRKVIKCLKK